MIVHKWGMVGDLHSIAHAELRRRVREKIPEGGFALINTARKWATVKDARGKRFRVRFDDIKAAMEARQ